MIWQHYLLGLMSGISVSMTLNHFLNRGKLDRLHSDLHLMKMSRAHWRETAFQYMSQWDDAEHKLKVARVWAKRWKRTGVWYRYAND